MTSKTTVAILAAAAGRPYAVPFSGDVSWLFAGEAASAFIRSVAAPRTGAPVFNLNGKYTSVENGIALLQALAPEAQITTTGDPIAFPMHHADDPLRAFIGDYGKMPLEAGIRHTFESFQQLMKAGKIDASQWI
jgi:hypothetical protein